MSQWMHWLSMGGYAQYVWPAYGLVCVVLVSGLFVIRRQTQQVRKKLHIWFSS